MKQRAEPRTRHSPARSLKLRTPRSRSGRAEARPLTDEMSPSPDEKKKLRNVFVTYVKKDGTTGTIEIPMFSDNTFLVPEINEAAADGDEIQLTLGGRAVKIKKGSKLTYNITFADKRTVFKGNVNVTTAGEGAALITQKDDTANTANLEEGEKSWLYTITTIPSSGYIVKDKALIIKYTGEDGKEKTATYILEDDDATMQIRISDRSDASYLSTTGGLLTNVKIKKESIVDIFITYIGKYILEVYSGKTTGEGENPSVDKDKMEISGIEEDNDSYTSTYNAKDGTAVSGTVKVLSLDAQNVKKEGNTYKEAELHAGYEDRIAIIVNAAAGYRLDKLILSFKAGTQPVREQAIVTVDNSIVDPNGGTTYLFYMPEANADIIAFFVKLEGNTSGQNVQQQEQQKNQSGKTIGAGAGFAMTWAELKVIASIGENRNITAGTTDVRAISVHETQTAAVAGTDPLAGATSSAEETETQKDVSLDAGAAVAVIDDEVKASIGEGTAITLNGKDTIDPDEEDPNTELVSFNLSAKQEGKTVTKGSSFAAGKSTAVGASVTVNITNL